MADTKPIPVRLPEDILARLDAAAERIGNTRAGIMRFLIETWLAHFERKGFAALPPDWQEIMEAQDGRTAAARLALNEGAGAQTPKKPSGVTYAKTKGRKKRKSLKR